MDLFSTGRSSFLAAAIVALIAATPASAANFVCQADPKAYLGVGGDGMVYTAINNGSVNVVTAICSVGGPYGSTTAQGCTAWYSMLLTARNNGAKALPHFNPGEPTNAGTSSCADFRDCQHHVAYYLLAQ